MEWILKEVKLILPNGEEIPVKPLILDEVFPPTPNFEPTGGVGNINSKIK